MSALSPSSFLPRTGHTRARRRDLRDGLPLRSRQDRRRSSLNWTPVEPCALFPPHRHPKTLAAAPHLAPPSPRRAEVLRRLNSPPPVSLRPRCPVLQHRPRSLRPTNGSRSPEVSFSDASAICLRLGVARPRRWPLYKASPANSSRGKIPLVTVFLLGKFSEPVARSRS